MNKLINVVVSIKVSGQWRSIAPSGGPGGGKAAIYSIAWDDGTPLKGAHIRREDGAPFHAEQVKVNVAFPLLNYAHVVVPDCGRHYVNVSKGLDIRSPLYRVTASNAGHPFFAVAGEDGEFLAAFGIVTPTGETEIRRILPRISQRKAMVGGDHFLSLDMVWSNHGAPAVELPLILFIQENAATWVHALREYTDAIKQRENIAYPVNPAAWNPTWCSWTAFCSSEMNDTSILANARIARDLGIRSVILDDGWFGTGLDDDHGVLNLGDYEPDPHKFPDLAGLVRKLQEMELKVLLWHAPLCIAETSAAYSRMRHLLIHQQGREFLSVNGLAMLCPSCPEVRRYVADETTRLMRMYGVDGIKADLYNCLPVGRCTSKAHLHDIDDDVDAVEAVMATQWNAAKNVRADVLMELKQDYGNVRLARYGTMVRAGDTAYDVDTNSRRCFYIQAYSPCVHNDYFVTSDHAEPRAIAMAMIRMITAGVPTIGNDLRSMPEPLRQIVLRWLKFYTVHLDMFRLQREPQGNDLSAWQGGDGKCAWVSAIWNCREVRLPQAARVFMLNGTACDDLYLRMPAPQQVQVEISDLHGRSETSVRLTLSDGSRFRIPSGSLAEFSTLSGTL